MLTIHGYSICYYVAMFIWFITMGSMWRHTTFMNMCIKVLHFTIGILSILMMLHLLGYTWVFPTHGWMFTNLNNIPFVIIIFSLFLGFIWDANDCKNIVIKVIYLIVFALSIFIISA